MIDQVFSVYDEKAEAYLPPFMLPKVQMALRTFGDTINNPESQMSRHPEDYQLFHLGQFDNHDASYELFSAPKPLGNGLQFKSQRELFQEDLINDEKRDDSQLQGPTPS